MEYLQPLSEFRYVRYCPMCGAGQMEEELGKEELGKEELGKEELGKEELGNSKKDTERHFKCRTCKFEFTTKMKDPNPPVDNFKDFKATPDNTLKSETTKKNIKPMEYLQPLSDIQISSTLKSETTKKNIKPMEYLQPLSDIQIDIEYSEIETNSAEIILDFNDIVGYDDIKKLLTKAVKSDSPVHVLISGPPSSSKTVFLLALEKSLGHSCHFIDGVSASKSGFVDYVMNTTPHPKYILIDELDKMERPDQPVLLNVLETGILQETKFKRARRKDLKGTWFFCTSNDNSKIIEPLLSRFYILEIPQYTSEQFHNITTTLLTEKYGKSQELAEEISFKVWRYLEPATIRDCVRFAKLCDTIEDVNWLIEVDKNIAKTNTYNM